jgi:hypothetical protein
MAETGLWHLRMALAQQADASLRENTETII